MDFGRVEGVISLIGTGGGSSSSFRTSILCRFAAKPVLSNSSRSDAIWRLFSMSLYSSEFFHVRQ